MSGKSIVEALNKESVKAVGRILQFILFVSLNFIGSIAIKQFDIIIGNQEKMFTKLGEHDRRLGEDSISIAGLVKEDLKLHRYDELFTIKQDAAKDALQNNSLIGIEFKVDYDYRYKELAGEYKFLNQ